MKPKSSKSKRPAASPKPAPPRTGESASDAAASGAGAELRMRSEFLWAAQARPTRGPKPTMDRDDVVRAAMGIADADGLVALTMHAVASALGFTTMALYRYFPNKEALIDACVDAAMGLPPAPRASGIGWRRQVRHWAHAKRAMLCSRPWLAELPFVAAPHGPNWLSWHEALLTCLVGLGLTPEDMMDMLSVVHGYVHGSSDTAISLARSRARGIPDEEWAAAVGADLGRAIGDPRYPVLSAILTSASGGLATGGSLPAKAGKPRTIDDSFFWGLERVLDGLAEYLEHRRTDFVTIR